MVEESIFGALELLVVGMLTVFVILLIIIYFGKLLIYAVNKFAPAEEPTKKKVAAVAVPQIDANTKAIIESAVNQITNGTGKVTNIQKL